GAHVAVGDVARVQRPGQDATGRHLAHHALPRPPGQGTGPAAATTAGAVGVAAAAAVRRSAAAIAAAEGCVDRLRSGDALPLHATPRRAAAVVGALGGPRRAGDLVGDPAAKAQPGDIDVALERGREA